METALSIIAIVISLISGGFALYTFIWTAKRDRKQATLEAFNRLQTEVFDKINLKSKTDVKNIAENPRNPEFTEYTRYLVRIEHFCIGVEEKIYDFKVTKKIAKIYLSDIWEKSLPIIEKKREIYPDEPQSIIFEKIVKEMNK